MRQTKIMTGMIGFILFHLALLESAEDIHFRYFTNRSYKRKFVDYVELSPYNKGNLYKIRVAFSQGLIFNVYYGTKHIAYCTTLKSALKIVNNEYRN